MLAAAPIKISSVSPILSYPSQIQAITIAWRLDWKLHAVTLNHRHFFTQEVYYRHANILDGEEFFHTPTILYFVIEFRHVYFLALDTYISFAIYRIRYVVSVTIRTPSHLTGIITSKLTDQIIR